MRYSSVKSLHIPVKNKACSGTGRLSKAALLSMMGEGTFVPPPLTETPLAEDRKQKILDVLGENGGNVNRASVVLGISASSLRRRLAQWSNAEGQTTPTARPKTTRGFYESIRNPWGVKSFDFEKREACVEIETPSSVSHLSFTVPSWKFPEG